MQTRLNVWCIAEGRLLGYIRAEPGEPVTLAHLRRNFVSEMREVLYCEPLFVDMQRDGAVMICPSCGNVVGLGLEGHDLDAVKKLSLRPLLGSFALPVVRESEGD